MKFLRRNINKEYKPLLNRFSGLLMKLVIALFILIILPILAFLS